MRDGERTSEKQEMRSGQSRCANIKSEPLCRSANFERHNRVPEENEQEKKNRTAADDGRKDRTKCAQETRQHNRRRSILLHTRQTDSHFASFSKFAIGPVLLQPPAASTCRARIFAACHHRSDVSALPRHVGLSGKRCLTLLLAEEQLTQFLSLSCSWSEPSNQRSASRSRIN